MDFFNMPNMFVNPVYTSITKSAGIKPVVNPVYLETIKNTAMVDTFTKSAAKQTAKNSIINGPVKDTIKEVAEKLYTRR